MILDVWSLEFHSILKYSEFTSLSSVFPWTFTSVGWICWPRTLAFVIFGFRFLSPWTRTHVPPSSKSGPFASRAFTTIPFSPEFHYPSHLFRLLLLRRLRLPLPLTERHCRCRRVLGPLGDHRAACPRSGALRERGSPLGCAEKRAHGSPPLTPEHPFGEPC